MVTLLQARRWHLDTRSLVIGLGLGIVLGALFVFVVWPWLTTGRERLSASWHRLERRLRSGGLHAYLDAVTAYAGAHHPFGSDKKLSQFFVQPVLWAPPVAEPSVEAGPSDLSRLIWLWPEVATGAAVPPPPLVTLPACLRRGRRLLLTGAAGAGKTTTLAAIAHACAARETTGPWSDLAGKLPIFLHVADLAASGWPVDPGELISGLPLPVDRLNRSALGKTMTEKLNAGAGLLLLDGVDELSPERLAGVADWLERWLAEFPETQVLLAAPLRGYGRLLQLGFVLTGLMPWRGGAAESFGRLWATTMGQPVMHLRRYWQPGQQAWQTVARLQLLADGAEADAPPERWIERMEVALRTLLPGAADDPSWLAPVCRDLWQQLARDLVVSDEPSLADASFISKAGTLLGQYDVNQPLTMRRLRQAALTSGLFVLANGRWRFRSPVWRDFLAAAELAHETDDETIAALVVDRSRPELSRFIAARRGPGSLPDRLLAEASSDPMQEGLFQLSTWLPEVVQQGDWRKTVLLRLGRLAMHPSAPEALRQRAVLALAQTREDGVLTLLRQQLGAGPPAIKAAVVAAVPAVDSDAALDLLIAQAETDDMSLRPAVVFALGWTYLQAAHKPVVRQLLAEDAAVQRAAAETLALNGGENAAILREAAEDSDPQVRRAAAFGLGLLREEWADAILDQLQRDDLWIVQSGAQTALANREGPADGWKPTVAGDLPWLIDWAASKGRGVPGGRAAVSLLFEAAAATEPWAIRELSMRTLGHLAEEEAVPALQGVSPKDTQEARELAYETLCLISRAHGGWVGK